MIECIKDCDICGGRGKIEVWNNYVQTLNGVRIRYYLCPNVLRNHCDTCSHTSKYHILSQDGKSRQKCLHNFCVCKEFKEGKLD